LSNVLRLTFLGECYMDGVAECAFDLS
jgi:hypothetical protein